MALRLRYIVKIYCLWGLGTWTRILYDMHLEWELCDIHTSWSLEFYNFYEHYITYACLLTKYMVGLCIVYAYKDNIIIYYHIASNHCIRGIKSWDEENVLYSNFEVLCMSEIFRKVILIRT